MTKTEVMAAVESLRARGWFIIDVIETRYGHAVIAADTANDHMTFETLHDALYSGIA